MSKIAKLCSSGELISVKSLTNRLQEACNFRKAVSEELSVKLEVQRHLRSGAGQVLLQQLLIARVDLQSAGALREI